MDLERADPDPGVHPDVPFSEYLALPYISGSYLKKFRESPASTLVPDDEPTDSMLMGSAAHCYVLEGPDVFAERYAIEPEPPLKKDGSGPIRRNTNEWKDIEAAFQEANQGKIILSSDFGQIPTLEILKGTRESLHSHPIIKNVLAECRTELTLVWDDEDSGERCKARIDFDPAKKTIGELKFTSSFDRFYFQIQDDSYDVRLGHYFNGAVACGFAPESAIFIFSEFKRPFRCDWYPMPDDWLDWSCLESRRLIKLIKECRENNFWPTWKVPEDREVDSFQKIQPIDCRAKWPTPQRRIGA